MNHVRIDKIEGAQADSCVLRGLQGRSCKGSEEVKKRILMLDFRLFSNNFQIVLISLDNDQLSVILIATITESAIRSDSDGANIVFIISLPTSRSRARIRPFPTNRFMPSSSFVCSSGDFRNSFMYIINPRIMDIAITTPAATSIPSVRNPKKGLINSSGVKAGGCICCSSPIICLN